MKRSKAIAFAGLVSVCALALPALAQERMMRPVGTATYDPLPMSEERTEIRIRSEDRRMRLISLEADTGDAEIKGLRVNYEDGSSERIRVRQTLREGDRLEPIRLEGEEYVRSVEVTYVPRGRVVLVLLAGGGRRAEPPPPPPPAREEWVELGCKNVSFGADFDRMGVSSPDRFKAIRLKATRYNIRVEEMGVQYEGGGRDVYSIRAVIPGNSRTNAIELRGERRRITQFDFNYSTDVITTSKPQLCIEALKDRPR